MNDMDFDIMVDSGIVKKPNLDGHRVSKLVADWKFMQKSILKAPREEENQFQSN